MASSPRSPVRVELDEGSERRATPFTRAWYVGGLALGLVLITGIIPEWEPTFALIALPDWVSLVLGITIASGSGLLLFGAGQHVLLSRSWALEQAGCTIAGAGWLAFSVTCLWAHPSGAFLLTGLSFTYAIALMVRWGSLRRREEVTRAVVESIQGDGNV